MYIFLQSFNQRHGLMITTSVHYKPIDSHSSNSIKITPLMLSKYCIKCTLCKKLFIGETGRRLDHQFREQLRAVKRNDEDASNFQSLETLSCKKFRAKIRPHKLALN